MAGCSTGSGVILGVAVRTRAPLNVHILFHPASTEARSLATTLAEDWMGKPGLQGLRVPVFLGREDGTDLPSPVDPDLADHTLVVVLVDSLMTNRVTGQGAAWAEFVRDLCAAHPPGGQHHALPVALDGSAFEFDPDLDARHFLALNRVADPERRQARLSFTMAVRALHLLEGSLQEMAPSKAPIMLFVSHAKKDLDVDWQDPVRWTQDALKELPVREWFDAREIREGESFEVEIRSGVDRADAMLVFLTDAWASRPWCRTEALIAKEVGTPIVVVDALADGEPRSFPYGGNTRLLRWRPPLRPPEKPKALLDWQRRSRTEGERMIAAGVREALRCVHAKCRLEGLAEPGDVVLDVAPEAARTCWEPPGATFLYPDPPLGREEQKLLSRIWPKTRFETPMMRLAQRRPGGASDQGLGLAVSVSESPNLAKHGLTAAHQRLLTDEIHLYLMLAGLQIVYGGKLEPEKLDDPDNFTLRLFQLARGYSGLAADAGATLAPVRNVAPWPLWTLYDHKVGTVFGRLAELEKVPCPDLGVTKEDLGTLPNGFVPPNGPLQVYAWARALTHMRERVTASTVARLCVGGRIEGYKGRLPGLVEEPLLSLRARKPLFLVGALGGCTELVIDLLEQRPRIEMTEAQAAANVQWHNEIRQLYERYGGEPANRDEVAEELMTYGRNGPAAALFNGLDDEENRELFATSDPHRIATLVLTGLERLGHTNGLSSPPIGSDAH